MTTLADTTITVAVPVSLCPMSLSKNGRAHWRVRHRDFQAQKEFVYWTIRRPDTGDDPLWQHAVMHIEWQYHTGRPPDDDNVVARMAGARDACELAGVVADDRHVRIGRVTYTRLPRGAECMAVVTLERG